MSHTVSALLLRNLHNVFGEIDPVRRRAAIEEIFHEDAVFHEPNGTYRGRDEIDRIAGVIKAVAPGDAYRYGGEEFAVVCTRITPDEAHEGFEQVRRAICEKRFALRGSDRPKRKPKHGRARERGSATTIRLSVSIGIAVRSDADASPEDVLRRADKALYQAKRAGRNRVKVSRSHRR